VNAEAITVATAIRMIFFAEPSFMPEVYSVCLRDSRRSRPVPLHLERGGFRSAPRRTLRIRTLHTRSRTAVVSHRLIGVRLTVPLESTAALIASGYFFLDLRFAHRRFCAAAIFARVAAENRRRFRGFRSIVAAGSADTSTG